MHTDMHTMYKLYQKGGSQIATTPAHLYLVHVNILREVVNWCCLLTSGCSGRMAWTLSTEVL